MGFRIKRIWRQLAAAVIGMLGFYEAESKVRLKKKSK